MCKSIPRTAFHIDNAQYLCSLTDRNTHFRARLPAFDGSITIVLQNIVNDNTVSSFKYVTCHAPDDWILHRFDGAFDDVLTCSTEAANREVPICISNEDCGKFICKITCQQVGCDRSDFT